jgi:hypothetical protein
MQSPDETRELRYSKTVPVWRLPCISQLALGLQKEYSLSETVTMLLQFISEPTISARERRLIRSHVMRGKNAGKSRQPKAQPIHKHRAGTTGRSTDDFSDELQLHTKHTLSIHRVYWNELSLTSYPCEISPDTERFVYQRTSLRSRIMP